MWCSRNMWAPEIHHVNGRFLAYFSCAAPNGRHSVGVAVSQTDSYLGPYVDIGVPLVYHNDVRLGYSKLGPSQVILVFHLRTVSWAALIRLTSKILRQAKTISSGRQTFFYHSGGI